jgi:hypothetical protein
MGEMAGAEDRWAHEFNQEREQSVQKRGRMANYKELRICQSTWLGHWVLGRGLR